MSRAGISKCGARLETLLQGPPHSAVAYAKNFYGGFHSEAYGGHLYLVCAVCDVTI